MPKRTDIRSVLIIGAGPIVIGQACEFDYSGTQAAKALLEEGLRVVLVNSNPATIMTDPGFATRTYIEPLTLEILEKIIAKERPDAVLPTVGGQTALNLAVGLAENGVLEKYGVKMIGANLTAIKMAEDRSRFKQAMIEIGLNVPRSGFAKNMDDAKAVLEFVGLPCIIRPSFTLGGAGGGVVDTAEEFFGDKSKGIMGKAAWGLAQSPVSEIMIEQSLLGWKEFELEVMRDNKDNVVIVCSIENLDAMGVHTGDSITVAPAQTLTDREYQMMRDAALRIIRKIGVDTGGSNIQFAVSPETGELQIIEMNPRVSRSSALASKATGFPIARIAAKLAIGYTLDEIPNDITKKTPASFEPTIDYCVTKIPRFDFDKFPQADKSLTSQMKSVGEVMAIGRTFKESFQKALRSLETGADGLDETGASETEIAEKLKTPRPDRIWHVGQAFRLGWSVEKIHALSFIDPWFLENIREIVETEKNISKAGLPGTKEKMLAFKRMGFSDRRLAKLCGTNEDAVRERRASLGVLPVYKRIDTCAAEFEAPTPYMYSTYEEECESQPTSKKKIMILGGGPNRIGQGIEFDYCCVHGLYALRDAGYETIMVNCNPETVSTDFDSSDRLYFEPLTLEDVLGIVRLEKPQGIIVQFGGQTPLKLAMALEKAGAPIIGTSPDAIDRAEDRERFKQVVTKLGLKQPENGTAVNAEQALEIANAIGYPVMVRPSYVLGGRAMEVVYDDEALRGYMARAMMVSHDRPVLVDRFLSDSTEVDVDALRDGKLTVIGGIMQHIEEAGIHSGDSACSLPPRDLSQNVLDEINIQTKRLADELNVVGLLNIQFAVKDGVVYVLEVNPRASRTVPFVSKAIGEPLAKYAARIMAGKSLVELDFISQKIPAHVSVKEAVFPFIKFQGVDPILGPEMKSTGEVMGIDTKFGRAFARATLASGSKLPTKGTAFISISDNDKRHAVGFAKRLSALGFNLVATKGTADALRAVGLEVKNINKVKEGSPHAVDMMEKGEIAVVINTSMGKQSIFDSQSLRRTALNLGIPYTTTMAAANALVEAVETLRDGELGVCSIQEYNA
ncbi:MAG: carbamoyl-phosphate synthase large subunit [Nitrospinae bacterium]|nr:carbamoyl-phosphate synthase large subunit [Nitrospinota bacterium]